MSLRDPNSHEFQDASKEVANAVNDLMAVMGKRHDQTPSTILSGVLAAAAVYGLVTKPMGPSMEEAALNLAKTLLMYAKQYQEVTGLE